MINAVTSQPTTGTDWRSDASIAYAIFRLSFGINICLRGVMRIVHGTDVFAGDLLKQFAAAPLPPAMITPFGHVLPWVESAIGLLLIVGLWTRPALILGGLMMAALTFGTMLIMNYNLALLQLTYSIAFFMLLAARSWDLISVDAMLGGSRRGQ
jgi:thiosulfate dehydrogenase (quinone) large subunit